MSSSESLNDKIEKTLLEHAKSKLNDYFTVIKNKFSNGYKNIFRGLTLTSLNILKIFVVNSAIILGIKFSLFTTIGILFAANLGKNLLSDFIIDFKFNYSQDSNLSLFSKTYLSVKNCFMSFKSSPIKNLFSYKNLSATALDLVNYLTNSVTLLFALPLASAIILHDIVVVTYESIFASEIPQTQAGQTQNQQQNVSQNNSSPNEQLSSDTSQDTSPNEKSQRDTSQDKTPSKDGQSR